MTKKVKDAMDRRDLEAEHKLNEHPKAGEPYDPIGKMPAESPTISLPE
jgi:hypothetical protein